MRLRHIFAPIVILAVVAAASMAAGLAPATAPEAKAASSFTFAAAGDFAMGSQGTGVIKKIGASNVNFFLNLGDMRYSSTDSTPEPEWCQWVKNNLNAGAGKPAGDPYGETLPVPLIAGNHEDGVTHTDGGITDNYAACPTAWVPSNRPT